MELGPLTGIWIFTTVVLSVLIGYFFPNYYKPPKGLHLSSHGFFHMVPIYIIAGLITFVINSIWGN